MSCPQLSCCGCCLQPSILIQVTDNPDHKINLDGLNKAIQQLQDTGVVVLLWCVPAEVYDTFKWQRCVATGPAGSASSSLSSQDDATPSDSGSADEGDTTDAAAATSMSSSAGTPLLAAAPQPSSGGTRRQRTTEALQPACPVRQFVVKVQFSMQRQQQHQQRQQPPQLRRSIPMQARGPRLTAVMAPGRLQAAPKQLAARCTT